ncbi:glycosyltransferase family 2 protein, partial [bacterium]|nr:glycosyltransferase family 2 protein [bacterium]
YENIAVIVPAYNEAERICSVLVDIKNYILGKNIFVIDDGSEDNTTDKAVELGVEVIKHEKNYGKGRAIITGLGRIKDLNGLSAVITLDADGQHDPHYIPAFIDKFNESDADIIIGNRMNNTSGMPLARKFSNKTTSWVISRLTRFKIPDSQSGYRLIRTSFLSNMILKSNHFDTESEILLRAGKERAKICSIPIRAIYSNEKSKMNPFVDTFRFLFLVIRSLFW